MVQPAQAHEVAVLNQPVRVFPELLYVVDLKPLGRDLPLVSAYLAHPVRIVSHL